MLLEESGSENNAALWFDYCSGPPRGYTNRFDGPEQLEHDPVAHVFRLFSADGSVAEFHDFNQLTYPQGLFKKVTSPGGQVTEVVSYSGGEIGEIQRSVVVGGSTITESLLYTQMTVPLLMEIVLRRKVNR